jgi:hypothetical protein
VVAGLASRGNRALGRQTSIVRSKTTISLSQNNNVSVTKPRLSSRKASICQPQNVVFSFPKSLFSDVEPRFHGREIDVLRPRNRCSEAEKSNSRGAASRFRSREISISRSRSVDFAYQKSDFASDKHADSGDAMTFASLSHFRPGCGNFYVVAKSHASCPKAECFSNKNVRQRHDFVRKPYVLGATRRPHGSGMALEMLLITRSRMTFRYETKVFHTIPVDRTTILYEIT